MKAILISVLVFISITGYAQSGELKVVDNEKGKPLPYVNICFESLKTKEKKFTTTNLEGFAKNYCDDSCKVAVSFVGFKTVIDTITKGDSKTYRLKPDAFNLDQIVVTATRSRKTLKNTPVITQVITSKEIENRGISNIEDIMSQDIPGIEFQRGGFGTDMKMQGLEAKNILVLIDGERLAGEKGYNIDYSRINPANIERIEVVKGAASALYGSKAMGGVINIITKKSSKKFEVNFGTRWAQMNQRNYQDLSKNDEKYYFKKNLDRRNLNMNLAIGFNLKHINGRTDIITKSFDAYQLHDKVPITKRFINIDTVIVQDLNPFPTGINGYKDYQVEQKLNFPVNKKIEFSVKGSYYNHDEFDFVPDKVHQKYIDYTFGGKVNYLISDKSNIVASLNYDNYKRYDVYEKLDDKSVNYKNRFINPKIVSFIQAGKHQQITSGVEFLDESLYSGELFADSAQEKQNSTFIAFVQDDISINNKLNFIIGGRLDHHSVYGNHFSPKISAMYKLGNVTFRANYAKGFRSPSLKELYINWQVAWFTIKGNKDLKPETNNYFSGSVEYYNKFIDISATAYYNKLKNKIDGVWENNQTVYQYVNVSEAELSGIDILAKIKPIKNVMITGGYSFLKDKRPQGELVSSASPHSGNVKAEYTYHKNFYNLSVNLTGVITGQKNYVVSEYINYRGNYVEGLYPVHFDAYSIWNLSVSQRFINGINLTVGINNIFNYTADVVSFNTSVTPGRRFFTSINILFDELIKIKRKNNHIIK